MTPKLEDQTTEDQTTEKQAGSYAAPRQTDTAMEGLLLIAAFHGIAVQEQALRNHYNLHHNLQTKDLLRLGDDLGLKTKTVRPNPSKLEKMPLPALAQTKQGTFELLLQIRKEGILLANFEEKSPQLLSLEEWNARWDGTLLLFAPKGLLSKEEKTGFRWFLQVILRYKTPLAQVLLAVFTLQILGLFGPITTQVIIDKVLSHHSFTTLNVMAIGLLLVIFFESVLGLLRTYLFNHTTSRIDVLLGSKLFAHLFSLPFSYFESRRTGDTIARVRELENIRQFLTGAPLTLALDLLFMALYLSVLFFYSKTLTLCVLGSLPLFALLSILITPLFKERLEEKFNCGADTQSYLVETISGVQTIKSYALENPIQKQWENLLSAYVRAGYKTAVLAASSSSLAQFIQKAFDLLLLWLGAHLVIEGQLSVGQLVAFRMLSSRISTPVLHLVQTWQDFQQAAVSVRRLSDIFHQEKEPQADYTKSGYPPLQGHIRFDKVHFRYPGSPREILRDINLTIPAGAIIGIVGRSGSGKSTLTKLIQRLYLPETGKISIDGMDLSLCDTTWLRKQIGVVLQESFLFRASIKDNIAAYNTSATMEQIIHCAKMAGAHDFILEQSCGYDTLIGERGTGLSGGQKQRIAIARALLTNPRILIFDEATSALDYESESIIQQNLKQICQGRTVLLIAHRLSALRNAHKIITMDQGQIQEYDTEENLLQRKGLYHHLYAKQTKGELC